MPFFLEVTSTLLSMTASVVQAATPIALSLCALRDEGEKARAFSAMMKAAQLKTQVT